MLFNNLSMIYGIKLVQKCPLFIVLKNVSNAYNLKYNLFAGKSF